MTVTELIDALQEVPDHTATVQAVGGPDMHFAEDIREVIVETHRGPTYVVLL